MSSALYLAAAVKAANKLRAVLETKVTGPYTVSPHAALRGGLVTVYLSDRQADELTEAVKDYRSPYRQDWMLEFIFEDDRPAMNRSGNLVLSHCPAKNPRYRCPDNWKTPVIGNNIYQTFHKAYEHLEVCGK